MSEQNPLQPSEESQATELEMLKAQAAMMGIKHSNNITVETLRKKIADKMEDIPDTTDEDGNEIVSQAPNPLDQTPTPAPTGEAPVRVLSLQEHLRNEAKKLVRIRISCMDPKKADLGGEIFTVANEYLGTVKKYVPFGEQTDNGFHVEQCILDLLRERKFLHIKTTTDKNGQITVKQRYVAEFSIEVLPPLTRGEIADLAADQRATGRLQEED